MFINFDKDGNVYGISEREMPEEFTQLIYDSSFSKYYLAPEGFDWEKKNAKLIDGEIVIIDDSILELDILKKSLYSQLSIKYSEAQYINIVNGVCFSAELKGEWYNSILEKRKSAAKSRADKLCFVSIPAFYSNDPTKTIKKFEGVLPLPLVELLDEKWDLISLQNWRLKEFYYDRIKNANSSTQLDFQFAFQDIQTMDLNDICASFVLDESQLQIHINYILSKKIGEVYHLFNEFDENL